MTWTILRNGEDVTAQLRMPPAVTTPPLAEVSEALLWRVPPDVVRLCAKPVTGVVRRPDTLARTEMRDTTPRWRGVCNLEAGHPGRCTDHWR